MKRIRIGQRPSTGFTIVELLIVIVVIGILAAIVIVAYNGVQSNARNALESSMAERYHKALLMYATDNNTYPNNNIGACLGEGYPNGCWPSSNNATFNTQLRPYMNNLSVLPTGNTAPISYYGTRSGIAYTYQTNAMLDGNPNPWLMIYFLEGVKRCNVGPVAGGSWLNFTSTPNANGATEVYNNQNTMCVIPLPNPISS